MKAKIGHIPYMLRVDSFYSFGIHRMSRLFSVSINMAAHKLSMPLQCQKCPSSATPSGFNLVSDKQVSFSFSLCTLWCLELEGLFNFQLKRFKQWEAPLFKYLGSSTHKVYGTFWIIINKMIIIILPLKCSCYWRNVIKIESVIDLVRILD